MSEKIKTVIVDDEALARQMVREYLADYPDIEIIAECGDGKQAVKIINSKRPDLIFLDIQMPEGSGFEVLTRLDEIPCVIFSTAFDQYALKAFEVNAVDYLLKPYDRARFKQSIQRVVDRIQRKESSAGAIASLLNSIQDGTNQSERMWIKDSGVLKPIRFDDIDWIEAMEDYACLHVGKSSYLIKQTMQSLEEKLQSRRFLRIHRSHIVNMARIRELRPVGDGSYTVILSDKTQLPLSRGQAKKLKDFDILQ